MTDDRYTPEVAVAAAKLRVTTDRILGQTSSPQLLKLALGDTSVLRKRVVVPTTTRARPDSLPENRFSSPS